MQLVEVRTNKDRKRYIDFIYKVYKNDKNFSDMNLIFVKNFLYKKDSYAKRANVIPLIVEDSIPQIEKNEIKLVCMFISTEDSKELKLSFLEFLPNSEEYLKAVIEYGKKLLNELNLSKIIVGINGQVSYGLGILVHGDNNKFEFNANYNPAYYIKELDDVIQTKKRAFSYKYDANKTLSSFNKDLLSHIYDSFTFRYLDKKHFKEEMLVFGELCHKTLKNTPYYSEKTPFEMYELMKQMKFLIKKEDFIFVLKDGKEVGFIFTHPDFAELFDKPKINYIKLGLRLFNKRPKMVIYNVIGVLEEYQKEGVAVGLIDFSTKMRKPEFPQAVSSFILEDNVESTNLCKKISTGINKEFRLYEIEE